MNFNLELWSATWRLVLKHNLPLPKAWSAIEIARIHVEKRSLLTLLLFAEMTILVSTRLHLHCVACSTCSGVVGRVSPRTTIATKEIHLDYLCM